MLLCIMATTISVGQSKCKMLFFDEFVDNNFNWGVTEDDRNVSYSVENGYYYIEGLQKRKAYMTLQQLEIDESIYFEIEASIKKESTGKKGGYGICFGYENARNYYGFIINDKGEYKYFEFKGGITDKIIPWTKSESVKQGIGTTTRLMIKKDEGVLKFYINGSLVAEKPFLGFLGNKFGIYHQRIQKIAVDYFRVLYFRK